MARFVELSHRIFDGMAAYPGLPAAVVEPILTHDQSRERYGNQAEFLLGRVELSANTGTYLDAPYHRHREREDLAGIGLERVASLPGVVVEPVEPSERAVAFDAGDLRGRAVLVRTGWDAKWGTPAYWEPGPFLGPDAIDALIEGGAVLVGVDFANVDDTADLSRPAHTRLLDAGILLVENMTGLGALPLDGFRFSAVPLAIEGGPTFPVRAYAELDG
jgi:kynurenine formamidase